MILVRREARPSRPGLAFLMTFLALLAAPLAQAGLTVSLTDGTSDDVRMSQPYIGPQAAIGGYVEWVVSVTSDDGEQAVALKDTLGDCMELLAYKDPAVDGTVNGTGTSDPHAGQHRDVLFHPPQPDAVVEVDGNTILITGVTVPEHGELRVTYWARVVGMTHVLAGNPETRATAVRDAAPLREQRRATIGRTLASRSAGVSVDGSATAAGVADREIVGLEENTRRSYRERPIESSACCHQVKVVGGEGRLFLSDGPYDAVAMCSGSATGFEVLVPGAPIPSYR